MKSEQPLPPKDRVAPEGRALDCRQCGACCAPPDTLPGYVAVSRTDYRRLPPAIRAHVRNGELATVPGPQGSRCICLSGAVGRGVECRIYPLRPRACRQFEAGTAHCLSARREVLGVD